MLLPRERSYFPEDRGIMPCHSIPPAVAGDLLREQHRLCWEHFAGGAVGLCHVCKRQHGRDEQSWEKEEKKKSHNGGFGIFSVWSLQLEMTWEWMVGTNAGKGMKKPDIAVPHV